MSDERPALPPLSRDDALIAATGAGIAEQLAGPNVFRVLLRHPPVAEVIAALVRAVVLDSSLDARLREMAILRVAWRQASVYEWTSHHGIAQRLGMTPDDIAAARLGPTAPGLGPVERAVLTLVDEALDHDTVSAPTLLAARDAVGDDASYLELLTIAGCYRALAMILDALQVPLDDGTTAWPPDGVSPRA